MGTHYRNWKEPLTGTARVRSCNKPDIITQEAQKQRTIQCRNRLKNIKSPKKVAQDVRIRQDTVVMMVGSSIAFDPKL